MEGVGATSALRLHVHQSCTMTTSPEPLSVIRGPQRPKITRLADTTAKVRMLKRGCLRLIHLRRLLRNGCIRDSRSAAQRAAGSVDRRTAGWIAGNGRRARSTPSCPHRQTKRLFMFQEEHTTLSVSLYAPRGEISRSETALRLHRRLMDPSREHRSQV